MRRVSMTIIKDITIILFSLLWIFIMLAFISHVIDINKESGAIGVYEGTIQCEQAMGEWVCRKIEKGLE